MPPNTGSGSGTILDKFGYSYKQVANPYSDTKHDVCFEECPGTSASGSTWEHEEPEQSVDDTVRVTTRARLTYELYKYSKNAMLIVTAWTRGSLNRNAEVIELKKTFENFRFEVEVVHIEHHIAVGIGEVNYDELHEKCGQFFQRDFTDYGAVALVIMMPMEVYDKPIPAWKCPILEESGIMDSFKSERNPTLTDKPKICIIEAGGGRFKSLHDHCNGLERATHGDVVGFHFHTHDQSYIMRRIKIQQSLSKAKAKFNGPLTIFCKKLAAMGDNVALPEIIAQTIKDSDKNTIEVDPAKRGYKIPIRAVNTLTKQLYLARVEENEQI